MIIRYIKKIHWDEVCRQITTSGDTMPLSKQYDININCDGVEYILRLQIGNKRRLIALQAVSVISNDEKPNEKKYSFVKDGKMISGDFDIAWIPPKPLTTIME